MSYADDFEEDRNNIADQIKADWEKNVNEAIRIKSLMKSLMDHEGFKLVLKQLEEQIKQRDNEVYALPQSLDDIVRSPYVRGEVAGLRVAVSMHNILIDNAQLVIDIANRQNNGENTQDK